jgi:hypothetical protein
MGRRVGGKAICLALSLLGAAGCQTAADDASGRRVLGRVEATHGGSTGPAPTAPRVVYVADFELDAPQYAGDEGVRGALPGRLGQRAPRVLARDDPRARAHQIVETMAEALVQSLGSRGFTAQRLRPPAATMPRDGWLVQGVFTEVDEGNRITRAVIGFGRGATTMDVQVRLSDLAGSDPRAPFAVFGTVKDPGMLPGAIVTLNPYVVAAKFVLAKHATERDIRQTADQIAEEITTYERQLGQRPAQE